MEQVLEQSPFFLRLAEVVPLVPVQVYRLSNSNKRA